MLTFCCVTLSMAVKPQRLAQPAESLPADSLPTSSPSGRFPFRSRGALAGRPRHPVRGPPALLSFRSMQTH